MRAHGLRGLVLRQHLDHRTRERGVVVGGDQASVAAIHHGIGDAADIEGDRRQAMVKWWWLIFGVIAGAIVGFIALKKRSEAVAHGLDRLVLKLPVIGKIMTRCTQSAAKMRIRLSSSDR